MAGFNALCRLRVVATVTMSSPALVKLGRVKLDFIGDDDDRTLGAFVRIQPQGARAARDDQPDVTVPQLVFPASLHHRARDLLRRERHLEQNRLGGVKQALDVLGQPEDAAMIGANPLENAVPVQQPVVEHRDFGVLLVVILAVDINFHRFNRAQSTAAWQMPAP
jgi:hypothetical protein